MKISVRYLLFLISVMFLMNVVSAYGNISCTDTDGGVNYYIKGDFSGNYFDRLSNTSRLEQGSDGCIWESAGQLNSNDIQGYIQLGLINSVNDINNHQILIEGNCNSGNLYINSYTCPRGCLNGACTNATPIINNTIPCLEYDGGVNITVTNPETGTSETGPIFDSCAVNSISLDEEERIGEGFTDKDNQEYFLRSNCNGSSCYVLDTYCDSSASYGAGYRISKCQLGCSNGACIKETLPVINNTANNTLIIVNNSNNSSKPITPNLINNTPIIDNSGSNITLNLLVNSNITLENKTSCDVIGLRKAGNYCSFEKKWETEKDTSASCENSFECSSNVCVNNECISGNLIQKIINWFRRLFGIE